MPGNKGKEPTEVNSRRSKEAEQRELEHDRKVRASIEKHRSTLSAEEISALDAAAERMAQQSSSLDMKVQEKRTMETIHHEVENLSPQPANRHGEVPTLAADAARSVEEAGKHRSARNWVGKHLLQLLTTGGTLVGTTTGVIALGGSITTVVVTLVNLNSGKTPPGLSEKDQAEMKETLERWQNKDEKEFWTEVGTLVDQFEMPLQTQQLMAALILQLCKPDPFVWQRDKDKLDAVYTLFDAYRPKRESKAMYDALAKFAYVRDPARPTVTEVLPRKEATSVLILALQRVIVFRRAAAAA